MDENIEIMTEDNLTEESIDELSNGKGEDEYEQLTISELH